jgi:hypothetical protein
MSDTKQPSYKIAFDARQKEIEGGLKSQHTGEVKTRDPELEMRPTRDSIELGQGSRK